jgi:hypothetical protein
MFLRRLQIVLAIALTAATCACAAKRDYRETLAQSRIVQNPEQAPMVVAAYQPWFGRANHINVGYNSQDPQRVQRQINEAKNLGIQGFVVNWYGPRHPFEDKAYTVVQEAANQGPDFKVAIMYDEDDSGPGDSTDAVLVDLQYAYDRYISSHAQVSNNSYLRFNGKPVIFIFPKGPNTDWKRVRQAVQSWEDPPLLIMKDINEKWKDAFDGFYAWVQPGKEGWRPDGSNWGRAYLENFYVRMNNEFPNKLAVGAAWPGFNDTRASWSRNRKMDAKCGKTFEEALRTFRRYHDTNNPLPILMIETWNDYEEGTAIEAGYATCGVKQLPATMLGGQ